jgi:SNF2 family DNA or RNA helicase
MLILTATHSTGVRSTGNRLALAFDWEYDLNREVVRMPLAAGEHGVDSHTTNADRDPVTESATVDRLRAAIPHLALRPQTLVDLAAAEFSTDILPLIRQTPGVRVDVVGEAPDYRELHETPHLVVTTHESDRTDWFDLGVVVTVAGRDIPFGPLFKALAKGHKKLLLPDKSYLSLDQSVFDQLRDLIEEAADLTEWETVPRISRFNASLWADFEDLADETVQAVAWRAAAAGLRDASVEPTPLPKTLTAELRPYQKDGFDWLAFLWQHRMGGILADDMGLGKTLQALALVAHVAAAVPQKVRPPFLVVAPTSVVSNWAREAAKFAPTLAVSTVTTTEAKSKVSVNNAAEGADIVVTSYALMRLDAAAYGAIEWAGIMFDEAQFLKNPASRAHEVALELRAPFKLAITGTPLENSLTDLWSLFEITAPGLFPSLRRFTEEYVRPVDRGANAQARHDAGTVGVSGERADVAARGYAQQRIKRLRKRIRPLMMRRTKELVATELPPKQEQELRVELAPRHRRLYDTVLQRERRKLFGLLDDLDRNRFIVFRSLTLLRMLSLDAALIDEKYSDIPSSKLDALLEQLEDVVAEGHRALMFSQFTSYLARVAARLDAQGISYAYLDGSTLNRAAVIDGFKDGTAPVFLISLKAGGFGLNLTEADYVFLLDPWWNPAAETQAIDRTHRIGQTRNVMVYRLIAADTIEEKVMALKARKSALFDAVLDDDAVFSSALTADDIRGLLE